MKISSTKLDGVYIILREPINDERGYFARLFCRRELSEYGICSDIVQANLSQNHKAGILRGLHRQSGAHEEDKLVACLRGEVFDVCVDVRPDSKTYGQYVGVHLSEQNNTMLYVPKGCAHGYLALQDDSQVLYLVTQYYEKSAEVGYRFNDPLFAIQWPLDPPYIITDKDNSWPLCAQ